MVVKIIEVVGTSKKSFDQATREAIARAEETLENVTGVDIIGQKLMVEKGEIVEYKVNLKIAFLVR